MEEKYCRLLTSCGTFTNEGEEAFSYIFEQSRDAFKEPLYVIRELHNTHFSQNDSYMSYGNEENIVLPNDRDEIVNALSKIVSKTKKDSIYTIVAREAELGVEGFGGYNVGMACRDSESGRLMLLPRLRQEKNIEAKPVPTDPAF